MLARLELWPRSPLPIITLPTHSTGGVLRALVTLGNNHCNSCGCSAPRERRCGWRVEAERGGCRGRGWPSVPGECCAVQLVAGTKCECLTNYIIVDTNKIHRQTMPCASDSLRMSSKRIFVPLPCGLHLIHYG